MKFKIIAKPQPNKERYHGDDFDKAAKLSHILQKELGEFVRSIVLFGSGARGTQSIEGKSDIDILILVNDVSKVVTPELTEAYRIIVSDCAAAISKKFHITTQKLTTFWDGVRQGDAVIVNMLRDGLALHDTGIFVPMQHLLLMGRIKPTKEAVWGYYTRAPMALSSAKNHLLGATFDLYWACMDAAHAALMSLGHMPATPEKVPEMLDVFLAKKGLLEKEYVERLAFFYSLSKMITHREIHEIRGEEFSKYQAQASDFVDRMRKLVEQHRPHY